MPYSKEHKQQSRERILTSAANLFTAQGFANTSVDQIMMQAGMTRGAFYAHFQNKSELYAQAMLFAASNSFLAKSKPDDMHEKEMLSNILQGYLSMAHINQEIPCPLAFLVSDVTSQDPVVRKTYTKIFKGMNKIIAENANAFTDCDNDTVLAITAMMIGGVAVGRVLDDTKTVEQLLVGCRSVAHALLNIG